MTPTNVSLGELDPARLSKLDANGQHIGGDKPTKEAFLHRVMYSSRAKCEAVVHLHSTHSVAVSCLHGIDTHDCLPPLTAYYVMRVGKLPLVPYHPPGDESLALAVEKLASKNHAVLLANHGPVVSGSSLEAALYATEELEETAKLFLLLRGSEVRPLTPDQPVSQPVISIMCCAKHITAAFDEPVADICVDGLPRVHFQNISMTGCFRKMLVCGVILSGVVVSSAYAAETPKPVPMAVPVSGEPTTTTASFGDWLMRCQRMPEGANPAKICEVAETIQVQGQPAPIAQIAIGRVTMDKPLNITVVLPSNTIFPSVVHVGTKDKDRELAWTRCLQGGCFAEASLSEDVLKAWRGAAEAGKLTFKDASGRDIAFPVSFKGLAQALDALAKAN
eukprot:gene14073-14191_t